MSALCFITPSLAELGALIQSLLVQKERRCETYLLPRAFLRSQSHQGWVEVFVNWGFWVISGLRRQSLLMLAQRSHLGIWFLTECSSIQTTFIAVTIDAVLRGTNYADESADRFWPRVEQVRRLGHCKAAEYVHLEPQIWSKCTSTASSLNSIMSYSCLCCAGKLSTKIMFSQVWRWGLRGVRRVCGRFHTLVLVATVVGWF